MLVLALGGLKEVFDKLNKSRDGYVEDLPYANSKLDADVYLGLVRAEVRVNIYLSALRCFYLLDVIEQREDNIDSLGDRTVGDRRGGGVLGGYLYIDARKLDAQMLEEFADHLSDELAHKVDDVEYLGGSLLFLLRLVSRFLCALLFFFLFALLFKLFSELFDALFLRLLMR